MLLVVVSLGCGQRLLAADQEARQATVTVDEGTVVVTDPSGRTHDLEAGDAATFGAPGPGRAAVGAVSGQSGKWEEKLDKQLVQEVSVNFQSTPLQEVLIDLQNTTNLNIILDVRRPDVDLNVPITLNLKKARFQSVLRWVVRLAKLEYAIRDEAIFLTPPKRIPADWREDIEKREELLYQQALGSWMPELKASLQRPVTFDFAGISGYEALDFLRTMPQVKVNVVIDPEAEAVRDAVMLRVTKMTLKNALTWLTKQVEIRQVLALSIGYITSLRRAVD